MSQINQILSASAALVCLMALVVFSEQQQQQQDKTITAKDMSEEMSQINKSLEGLLSELAMIKHEATGRLSQARNKPLVSSSVDSEQIRQTKVSKFVLKRVAELELESLGMRDEMSKLFELQKGNKPKQQHLSSRSDVSIESKQEDIDFDDASPATKPAAAAPTTTATTTTTTQKSTEAEEAAQIGLDLEALKKLGEEIGKRVDQFGKEAAKNLAELLEGIKLVFREKPKVTPQPASSTPAPSSTVTECMKE